MLDGGPSRVPQPFDRRAMQRPIRRQPEESQPVEPASSNQPEEPKKKPAKSGKSRKPSNLTVVIVLLVVVLAVAGVFAWSNMQSSGLGVDKGKYQAVFLSNGEIVFGKLEKMNSDYLRLRDVFYIKTTEQENSSDEESAPVSQNNMQLVKRGDEVHGPEDSMVINRDQVVFFENLKTDGQVAKLINNYKSQNK